MTSGAEGSCSLAGISVTGMNSDCGSCASRRRGHQQHTVRQMFFIPRSRDKADRRARVVLRSARAWSSARCTAGGNRETRTRAQARSRLARVGTTDVSGMDGSPDVDGEVHERRGGHAEHRQAGGQRFGARSAIPPEQQIRNEHHPQEQRHREAGVPHPPDAPCLSRPQRTGDHRHRAVQDRELRRGVGDPVVHRPLLDEITAADERRRRSPTAA